MAAAQETVHQPRARTGSETEGGTRQRWPPGCLLTVRGKRWRLQEAHAYADCQLLRLIGVGRTAVARAALLCPFDQPRLVEQEGRLHRVSWQCWLRGFRRTAVSAAPLGRLRTAAAAHIDLHAYQLEPSLAVLNGFARRLLLADEVGLGKTIQAGLVVSELHAREPAARTLILTPAGLRDQWACELRERFALDATVVDAVALRRALGDISAGSNPWAIWPVIVASIDFVKRPDALRALDPFTWDALVLDEAHQCALAPERSAAVRWLAGRSRHVLLLTATPHAGDDQSFERLCSIGRTGDHDRVVMFRRNRPDVGLPRERRVHLLRVRCSQAEIRMHRLLERYADLVWRSPGAGGDARLAMIVLRKRALSSAAALTRSLERRIDALFDVPPPASQLALPFAGVPEAGEDTPEDDEPIGCLGAPGMDGARERDWLDRVLNAARKAAGHESKLRALRRLLRRAGEPAIVFTEFRDTAHWLAAQLADSGSTALLHGGLSRIERQEVERQFRSGQAHLLVATDAAGQGLNLHHRSRLVVNLELPWNPMRLEQRIGRVDRLGQTRNPHAVHLVLRGTAEERIVRRLVVRQERARRRVGEVNDTIGTVTEEQVATAVMERHSAGLQPPDRCGTAGLQPGGDSAFTTLDVRALAEEELVRLSRNRLLSSAARRGDPARRLDVVRAGPDVGRPDLSDACIAVMPARKARASALGRGVLCVFVVRAVDDEEQVLDEAVLPLHLRVPRSFALTVSAGRTLATMPLLEQHALAATADQRQATMDGYRRAITAALEHERAMEATGARAALVQPGMFDRRALDEAERVAAGRAMRQMERAERLTLLANRASRPLAWCADLALVLLVP